MPEVYEKLGIRFEYPDNWTLDESEADESRAAVTVYSPTGAFWTVVLHPPGTPPEQLVATAVDVMRAEYEQLDAENVQEMLGDQPMTGSDLNFFCLDLTNTAQIRSFDAAEASYLFFWQAEDREFAKIEKVFRAMTASLLAARG